jgi:pyrroline-5-carboxylate reductase
LSRKKAELLVELAAEGFRVTPNVELVKECELIILAVLPSQAEDVLREIAPALKDRSRILASVVSVVTLAQLKEWSGMSSGVARIMPNTAAEFGAGMTCLAGDETKVLSQLCQVLEPLGKTMIIKEHLMPAATIMGACGIAFFLRFIRAVSQGGIQIGFHAEEAGMIAAQTAMGAAHLLMETGHHPETEIDKVTTPMGVTIAGLNEMEHYGLSSAMIKGIVKSYSGISGE